MKSEILDVIQLESIASGIKINGGRIKNSSIFIIISEE